jgi:hypothetical protein
MAEGSFLKGDDDGLVRTLGKPEWSCTLHYITFQPIRNAIISWP